MPLKKKLNLAHRNRRSNGGFTLVEVLVAIFMFGVAFTATSYVLTINLGLAANIENSFVASGLAQEGLEVARSLRDSDWFLGNSFGTSIPDGIYRVQWNSPALIPLGANPNIKFDSTNGIFSYDSGVDSRFTRTLTITTITPDVEKRIVVTLNWIEGGGLVKSVNAESHFFNWK